MTAYKRLLGISIITGLEVEFLEPIEVETRSRVVVANRQQLLRRMIFGKKSASQVELC